jgi:hypothetical protein
MRLTGIGVCLSSLVVVGLGLGWPAVSNPDTGAASLHQAPVAQPTAFLTPTPGPDGKIIYIVQEGDTLFDIAAIAGISVDELMAVNHLESYIIIPGMRLELGLGGPVVSTLEPGGPLSATPIPPTATPVFGTGQICVLLFLDENGNARREEAEPALAGGQVNVVSVAGVLVGEHTTDDTAEGYCFPDLPNGDYNVSAGVPANHNPTTSTNLPAHLEPGDTKYVEFGAQAATADGGGPGGGTRSTVLGLVGVFLLVAAGALGYYAARLGRTNRFGGR